MPKMPAYSHTYQFIIELQNVNHPTVWRRMQVPDRFTFHKFHKVIQAAFGWKDYHLYEFNEIVRSELYIRIGIPDEDSAFNIADAKKVNIGQVFLAEKQFKYTYDFGDYWEHTISLEMILDERTDHASLIDGGGACPPEDCGGFYGYEDLKKIIADPLDEQHEDLREWLGLRRNQQWDADRFDLDLARRKVAKI